RLRETDRLPEEVEREPHLPDAGEPAEEMPRARGRDRASLAIEDGHRGVDGVAPRGQRRPAATAEAHEELCERTEDTLPLRARRPPAAARQKRPPGCPP